MLQSEEGVFKAWNTEWLPFDGERKRARRCSGQFEIVIKHPNTKTPEDIVCEKCCTLSLKAMLHHLYKAPTWHRCHAQHGPAAEGLVLGATCFGKENSDCRAVEREEKKLQQKLCMAKPRRQRKRFTQVFQVALANCSLCSRSRLQYFRDDFISAEKMLKESLTRASL